MIARHRQELIGWNPANLVFPAHKGGYMHPGIINAILAAICEIAGITRITFHGLRHTSGTEHIESGIPIKTVSERLGHATIATTLNLYVHPDRAAHQRAADAIGIRLRGRRCEIVTKPDEAPPKKPEPSTNGNAK